MLNWSYVQNSLYRLSAITINLIADALAQDIVVLNLDSGNNIVYRYSTTEAITEGYGTNRVVCILDYLLLESTNGFTSYLKTTSH